MKSIFNQQSHDSRIENGRVVVGCGLMGYAKATSMREKATVVEKIKPCCYRKKTKQKDKTIAGIVSKETVCCVGGKVKH